ncbi:MAG: ribbon-helix-helix protein, CopG family [Tissierellia bacterium]|nr:ribbon-helix-helix protein, CopG family [Tissierellia bacterium]
MSIISLRISSEEDKLIRDYAKTKGISISDLVREAVMEKIEDDIDINIYTEAMKEHEENPQDISFDEMMEELDLND